MAKTNELEMTGVKVKLGVSDIIKHGDFVDTRV